jgi:hypothetical protein
MSRALAILGAALLASSLAAQAEIYRCTSPSGAVTYQQSPCALREEAKRLDIPENFPEIDADRRARLLAQEAALDRRLEARRERENREALARAAAEPPAPPEPQAAPEPQIAWMLPPVFPAHRHAFGSRTHRPHFHAPHPRGMGGGRY